MSDLGVRRVGALARHLGPPPWSPRLVLVRHCRARSSGRRSNVSNDTHHPRQQVRCLSSSGASSSSSSTSSPAGAGAGVDNEPDTVTIGGVSAVLRHPARPELVPRGFLPVASGGTREGLPPLPQSSLAALRWMMQKDAVGQDLFLVGPPGAARRLLALQWCELLQREVELLTISRDTTESELKQRREIESAAGAAAASAGGAATGGADGAAAAVADMSNAGDGGTVSSFVDQGPVRAALHGRVLILDGLEKAERNVLPTLNNLLENREMALDDGRFIVGAAAWDGMVAAGHSDAELHERNLVRAHDSFRVIALGLAVPPYAGAPLDPPLRSRFQARWIDEPAAEELTAALIAAAPSLNASSTASIGSGALRPLVQVSEMMHTLEAFGEQMAGTGRASAGEGGDGGSSPAAMAAGGRFPHMQAESLCSAARTLQLLADGGAPADAAADAALLRDLVCRGFPWAMPPVGGAAAPGISLPASAAEHQRVARAALERAGLPVALDNDAPVATGQTALAIHSAERVSSDTLELEFALPTSDGGTGDSRLAKLSMRGGGLEPRLPATLDPESGAVSSPPQQSPEQAQARPFFALPAHSNLLASMALDVAAGRDLLLLGNKGGGKSAVAGALAASLGYRTELVPLYRDMTARELLQRRATTSDGVTYWQDAPLVRAARAGRLAVLDGIDRLAPDTAATLMPLLQERWVELPDGTRLCRDPQPNSDTAGAADAVRVEPIHPAFRVIALGSHPGGGAGLDAAKGPNAGWFSEETVSMFATHVMPQLSVTDETALLCATSTTAAEQDAARALAALSARMRGSTTMPVQDGQTDAATAAMLRPPLPGTTLSLRQLLRVCRQYSSMLSGVDSGSTVAGSNASSKNALADLVRRSLLADFFSPTQTSALDDAMESAGIFDVDERMATDRTFSANNVSDTLQPQRVEYVMADGRAIEASEAESGTTPGAMVGDAQALRIGDVEVPLSQPKRPELVPRPLFYAIAQHVETLRSLLSDVHGGERQLLLIGNQGVGKNKLADRLLQLLRMEREYVQLHRDTTVASLSSTPSLKGGAVVYSEAPLVRAARFGRAVVLDEADKAPLEVVTVLKGLLEDGEMPLADGRRLLAPHRIAAELEAASKTSSANGAVADSSLPDDVIPIHPQFSMWVLANRPGFPFHGNDFFRECGDTFSAHCIANPDHESELELLRSYAPDVPNRVLAQLGGAFTELRELASAGLLAYPYSARESVAVARHLQLYPADGITDALEGVLAFDAADERVRSSVAAVFERHGIIVEAETLGRRGAERTLRGMRPTVALAQHMKLEPPVKSEEWKWAWPKQGSSGGKADKGTAGVGVEALTEYGMIPFMNMYLPPDSSASAQRTSLTQSMERVRLNRFSEEDRRVWLPFSSRFQRACSLAFGADGDSVHALTTEPLGIYSYHGLASTAIGAKQGADGTSPYMTAVQLQGGWPTDQPSSLPSLCAIPRPGGEDGTHKDSGSDLLVVHLPAVRDGLMMLVDPEPNPNGVPWLESGREAAALQVPPEPAAVARVRSPLPLEFVPPSGGDAVTNSSGSVGDGESSPMRRLGALSRMIGGGQFSDGETSDTGAVKLVDTLRADGLLLRYREGGTSLTMIRIAPGAVAECARVELSLGRDNSEDSQAGIRSVQVLSRDTWKIDTTADTQVLVNGALSAAFGASTTDGASGFTDMGEGMSAIRIAPVDIQQSKGARSVNADSQVPVVLSTPPAHAMPTVALPPAHLGGSVSPVSSATVQDGDAAESGPDDAAPEPAIIDWSARSLAHPQHRLGVLLGAPFDGVVVNGCPSPSSNKRAESGSIAVFSSARGDGVTDVGSLSPAEPIARTEAEAYDDMTWARAHRSMLIAADLPHTGQHLVATALRAEPGTSETTDEAWAPGAPWTEVDGVELEITDPAELSVRSIRLSSATEPLAPHLREADPDESSAQAQTTTEKDAEGAGGALCAGGDRSVSLLVGAGELSNGETVTLQANGAIRFWQVDAEGVSEDLDGWRRLFRDEDIDGLGDRFVGDGSDDETRKWLQIARRGGKGDWSKPRTGTDMPKHGKAPDGKAHVGGNTWAGGSGGSDTAGLGGRGGPYRLDGGHPVHQITEAAKAEVSEEARERAKQMAKEGLEERLKEIDMTGGEWQAYEQYYGRISAQVAQLRVILEGVESRAQERVWLRHQSSGEIDDAKIVDGAAGERNIFRRRGSDASRRAGQAQPKPKRLIFAFDVSGSMYRFNGQDGRLERSLEAAMMLMESFVGSERRFQYALVGHSGDSASIPFVEFGKPPANRKERLAVLQRMLAHSQFCMSGDHTLEAAAEAVEAVADPALGEADEMMAFVISDANLRRYGIPPEDLGQALMADSRVKAHAIFIASMADEAQRILRALPTGRGYVCLDSSDLPATLKEIFSAELWGGGSGDSS